MFLEKILSRNEKLIDAAVELHQQGLIPANAYVIDLDAVYENGVKLAKASHENGMKLYPMTKQIGRNPAAVRALNAAGAEKSGIWGIWCKCPRVKRARQCSCALNTGPFTAMKRRRRYQRRFLRAGNRK